MTKHDLEEEVESLRYTLEKTQDIISDALGYDGEAEVAEDEEDEDAE